MCLGTGNCFNFKRSVVNELRPKRPQPKRPQVRPKRPHWKSKTATDQNGQNQNGHNQFIRRVNMWTNCFPLTMLELLGQALKAHQSTFQRKCRRPTTYIYFRLHLSEPLGPVLWHSCGRREPNHIVLLVPCQPSTGLLPRNWQPAEECIADNDETDKSLHLAAGRWGTYIGTRLCRNSWNVGIGFDGWRP